MDRYTLLDNNLSNIPQDWFEARLRRRQNRHPALESCFTQEVRALQAYQDGEHSLAQAAQAITRPISSTPIPHHGGDSDDVTAVCQLWDLLIDALVEWPTHLVPSLIALIVEISKTPDPIHRGETIEDEEPLSWKTLPLMYMCWYDSFWQSPGDMVKKARDFPERERARAIYLKAQDAEAQLIAAGFLRWTATVAYIISVLERGPQPHDDDPDYALFLIYPDFHLPAVHSWVRHNGRKLFQCINNDNLEDWHGRDKSLFARHFENPRDRWEFWKEALLKLGAGTGDDTVLEQAKDTIQLMESIEQDPENQKKEKVSIEAPEFVMLVG